MATTHDKPGFLELHQGREVEVITGVFKGEVGIVQGIWHNQVRVAFPPHKHQPKVLELWIPAFKLRFKEEVLGETTH
jgi:hypothetical protein